MTIDDSCRPIVGARKTEHNILYRPEIDGLRALAVTLVVLVHAFPPLLPNGFIGVDIFFVISGFLITGNLVAQLKSGSFDLRDFYARRANRIFPALILVLAACMAFGWVALYANEFELLGRSVASGAGFVANVNYFLEAGYWDVASKLKPLLHLWSLGVEEQFYLVWPLLLWAVWSVRFGVAIALAVVVTASLAWNLWEIRVDHAAAFYLPFSRFWELLVGGTLACAGVILPVSKFKSFAPLAVGWRGFVDRIHATAPGLLNNACAALGFAMIALALVERYPALEFPGRHAILPVVGAALIIGAGSRAWLNTKVLSHPWIVYIGLISYPLYLWHWPLLSFGRILENGEISSQSRNFAVALAVMLAIATYHLVERPIRVNRHRRGLKAIALFAILCFTGAAGFFIYAEHGIGARYAGPSAPSDVTPQPKVTTAAKVVLLGDSNAGQFQPVLFRLYHDKLVTLATPGWPYLAGTGYKPDMLLDSSSTGTPQKTDEALARIVSDPEIDVVIIAHMFQMYGPQDTLRSLPMSAPGETSAMAYEAGLRRTVQMLTNAGKKVVYVKSIPFIGSVASVVACSSSLLPIKRKRPEDCVRDLAEVRKSRQPYDEIVAGALLNLPGSFAFDTLPFLCDDQHCYVERDGVLMYRDVSHLSLAGSFPVTYALAKFIEKLRANVEAFVPRP